MILFDNDVNIQLNLQLVPFVTSISVTPPPAAFRTQLLQLVESHKHPAAWQRRGTQQSHNLQ